MSEPADRRIFNVAIICALPLEADAVLALFDRRWDDQRYVKPPEDNNAYSMGMMGPHNVVVTHLPNMGKVAAATVGRQLLNSFPNVSLALIVGICGGVPFKPSGEEIVLGDVVISDGVVQYDFGRQYPTGFLVKDTPWDTLPRPSERIRSLLAKLRTDQGRKRLEQKIPKYFDTLRHELGEKVAAPSPREDKLFNPAYYHQHRGTTSCSVCASGRSLCDEALSSNCSQLGCDERQLVPRGRLQVSSTLNPAIHVGRFACGDTVMKSGEDRDRIATQIGGAIAFEMESVGIWEMFPSCLVVKGVCDYADSHKNKTWQNYAAGTAAAATKAFLEEWNPVAAGPLPLHDPIPRTTPELSTRQIEVLQKLYASPYHDRKNRNPDRIEGTCEWFTSHEIFQEWKKSESSRLLWVSADPGCGKSVLAKYLIDEVLPTTSYSTTTPRKTCYFFFKDDFEDQRSVNTALSCILHQLFLHNPTLLSNESLERLLAKGERISDSFGDLWKILLDVARAVRSEEIICILDAIDECEEKGRLKLAEALCKLYKSETDFNLKFLLTSRPYIQIRRGFQPLEIPGLPVIHLSGENDLEMKKISREIDVYIKAKVMEISASLELTQDERDLFERELMRVPNRTYLWVYLTLESIQTEIIFDRSRLLRVLTRLPHTVDAAYERILSKSPDLKEIRKLLHIIVGAARPLTLDEMSLALTLNEHHRSYADIQTQPQERFRQNIRDLCGLFIMVVDAKIYLLHQTAKEFLVHDGPVDGRDPGASQMRWKHSLLPRQSHAILAEICIRHLLWNKFESEPPSESALVSQYADRHIFLEYSASHWAAHFRESGINDETVTPMLLALCDVNANRCLTWFYVYWVDRYSEIPQGFTALMIASYFGLVPAVKALLEFGEVKLNATDTTLRRSALTWATINGFDVIVNLLLNGTRWRFKKGFKLPRRPKVDLQDRDRRTPLVYAVWNDDLSIAKLLVKKGARVDIHDKGNGSPVSYALTRGNETMARMLLKDKTQLGGSAASVAGELLISAAKEGDEAVVKLLIGMGGVDLNVKDKNGMTSIMWAAKEDQQAIVKLLLESEGVDINARNENRETVLFLAARIGWEGVVKVLLESEKVDINARNNDGETALLLAAWFGREGVVKLLLESEGVDINARNDYGETALLWAARIGWEGVVKLLLESEGVDINARNNYGETALLWAARIGSEGVVKLLLESKGVDINARDNNGETALLLAARIGSEGVVKLLLETEGVDINAKDDDGETALLWAARIGSESVVKLLLESEGVDVELSDKHGGTALDWCIQNKHTTTSKLFREYPGAGIGRQDGS